VPFVIAGKFGTPSTNDKDTIIEAHENTEAGPVIGTKALMVRVRKDANTLTASERDRFLLAWQKFRNKLGDNYVQFQEMHRLATMAGDEAHMQPAFLPWHRAMLLHVERELQKLEPTVALHYWNWDAAAPNLFTEDFIGARAPSGFLEEPVFSPANPLNGWNTDLPFSSGELRRNTNDHTADPAGEMKPLADMVADWDDYGPTTPGFFAVNSFSDDVEKWSHNPAHGWPCAGGQLTNPNRSAADPLFYLLHSQIDREWAFWQKEKDRHGVDIGGVLTFPFPAHYDNNGAFNTPPNTPDPNFRQKGSYLEDGLWPWDGTTGGVTGMVEWRPPNQAGGPGDVSDPENIPASKPLIPSAAFPGSVMKNLWPAVATIPQNKYMIDYPGKFRPQDGLGICYDDVAY
jgi:tyrosinase